MKWVRLVERIELKLKFIESGTALHKYATVLVLMREPWSDGYEFRTVRKLVYCLKGGSNHVEKVCN